MDSKTTIKWIDGIEYEIKKVEKRKEILVGSFDQWEFIKSFFCEKPTQSKLDDSIPFAQWINENYMRGAWENYLINQARLKGFISGCQVKTATDIDIMKSGRLELIGLSKLSTTGRKQIIIYDYGQWIAEAIPEIKKHWFVNDTLSVGKTMSREDMSKVKCEVAKDALLNDLREIIGSLTRSIDGKREWTPIHNTEAKLIREILNDYLK